MTDRIRALNEYQRSHQHHTLRQEGLPAADAYRQPGMPDFMRTALRLKLALEAEIPVLLPGELIAFTRTVKNLPMIYTEAEWAGITKAHYIHENGNVCNLSPDYARVLDAGLLALRSKLTDSPYHQAMAISIDAILALTARYEQAARDAGDHALADTLAWVPAHRPRTFREALQSLRILHFAMWCEGNYHNTLGRFDQYMIPYLASDLEAGRETEDSAFELLEAFFVSCNRDSDLYPGMQQGDNGQSIVLGGITREGGDAFNLLSRMCLKASADLMLIDPKINLRVNAQTPKEIYELGTELTKLGLGFPQYENDDVVIPGMVRLGYDPADAWDYAVAACWEIIIPGKGMDIPNIGALPFANLVDSAIRANLTKAPDMEALMADIERDIFAHVRKTLAGLHDLYVIPSPYMSLFFDGCLENGRDIALGCKYNNFGLHGTGLAPAADMLCAVQQKVFGEGLSPQTLLSAVDANFEGYEELRYALRQCPKMGNNDDRADKWGMRLLDIFSRSVEGLTNERGGIIRAGTGSAMYYIWHARELGATVDGRASGVPLPANYAPSLHVKLEGPLSLVQSFAKPDLSRVVNGGPLTIEFSDTAFRSPDAVKKVASLVQYYVKQGGHQLQLNTLSRDTLLDAQKHPEQYRNLIVRVWGWSGYFVELDKCYQDHIISRVMLNIS